MITTFKASVKKTEKGLQTEGTARGFKIILDEPAGLGGSDTGMNPVEALLVALGGCQAICAAAFAKANGVKFEEFHTELEGDIDLDGFMGKSDVRPGFQEIRFTMHFKTDEPQEKIDKFVKFIEKTCPVGDTIGIGTKLVCAGGVIDK
ncbi:MAG TPA: OsmC family protein [Bacillota bacterium]|nr:OsmC family protein [Bacillota bacterium]HPJ86155.1 OsmC family protein [Bacillota bacterium]HPQ62234.1 OsmC family protein [Bacillota bacterium]